MPRNLHSLKKPRVRQDWSKYTLYNLSRLSQPQYLRGTFYQQKWSAKSVLRGYHSPHVREGQWQRMFDRRLPSVVPTDYNILAKSDGREHAAGRGSGLALETNDEIQEQSRKRGLRPLQRTPYMNMAFYPLERRLDTAIFRAMFASSTNQARQMVVHGHVTVNGKKMIFPGYLLNPGDMFSVDPEHVLYATGSRKTRKDTPRQKARAVRQEQQAKLTSHKSAAEEASNASDLGEESTTSKPRKHLKATKVIEGLEIRKPSASSKARKPSGATDAPLPPIDYSKGTAWSAEGFQNASSSLAQLRFNANILRSKCKADLSTDQQKKLRDFVAIISKSLRQHVREAHDPSGQDDEAIIGSLQKALTDVQSKVTELSLPKELMEALTSPDRRAPAVIQQTREENKRARLEEGERARPEELNPEEKERERQNLEELIQTPQGRRKLEKERREERNRARKEREATGGSQPARGLLQGGNHQTTRTAFDSDRFHDVRAHVKRFQVNASVELLQNRRSELSDKQVKDLQTFAFKTSQTVLRLDDMAELTPEADIDSCLDEAKKAITEIEFRIPELALPQGLSTALATPDQRSQTAIQQTRESFKQRRAERIRTLQELASKKRETRQRRREEREQQAQSQEAKKGAEATQKQKIAQEAHLKAQEAVRQRNQEERRDAQEGLSPEQEERLQRIRENPFDATKPYQTPWKPREFMSAFAFVPRYLEVNQNVCSAVYLRHPVARPGLAEVPTPFHADTLQLGFNWYLRRR